MSAPTSLEHLSTLADSTRSRLLLLLERHELTVGELCAIVQLPQSTVSRHLKVLGDDGWVTSRAEGTSRYYRIETSRIETSRIETNRNEWAGRLWSVVREEVSASPAAQLDVIREESVLAARRARSREFFSSAAGEWESMRTQLFGERLDLQLALSLLDPRYTIGDLGCGTGAVSALLAPNVARIIAVDSSDAMLAAARARLGDLPNVDVRQGELEALPIDDGVLDVAILVLVLPYAAEPVRVLHEARRVLAPDGQLVVVDTMPHGRDDLRHEMGQLWQGFAESQMRDWLTEAGFVGVRYRPLPPDESAKGPVLFTADGRRQTAVGRRQIDPT